MEGSIGSQFNSPEAYVAFYRREGVVEAMLAAEVAKALISCIRRRGSAPKGGSALYDVF